MSETMSENATTSIAAASPDSAPAPAPADAAIVNKVDVIGKATSSFVHERQLLRDAAHCRVEYDAAGSPEIVREPVPHVPGCFVLHNVLTLAECRQHMAVADALGWEASPMRSLATVNATSFRARPQFRNSERVMLDAPPALADVLNERVQPHLPRLADCDYRRWELVRGGVGEARSPINGRWRYNRYRPGQFFKPHYDSGYVHSQDEKTLLTFILYLNDDFNLVGNGDSNDDGEGGAEPARSDGGATVFYPDSRKEDPRTGRAVRHNSAEVPVIPRTGSCVVFFQTGELSPLHEGRPHTAEGKWKYILRSDVSYLAVKGGARPGEPAFGMLPGDQLFGEECTPTPSPTQ